VTFEPTNPIPGEDDDQSVPHQQQRDEDTPSFIARFSRYLAARRDAGLGPRDPHRRDREAVAVRLPEEREGVAQAGRACAGCLSQGVLALLIVAALLWAVL